MFKCCLSALTQPHNRFATRYCPVDDNVVRSWSRNQLLSDVLTVKSLLLLWKPHSWF